MPNPIDQLLQRQGVMILDGGTATELENKGCDLSDSLWSARMLLDRPDLIREVHLDYLKAGADIATSASYQATVEGFVGRGCTEEQARELIRLSVRLAAEARDAFWSAMSARRGRDRPLVVASVGPYGAFLADGSEYRGGYGIGKEELSAFHGDRMDLLLSAGADLLACETLPCLDEALALAELVQRRSAWCWVSFTCRDGGHISDGTPIEACVEALEPYSRVAAVGVNCLPPHLVAELVARIKTATRKPVVVYPNSGEAYDPVTKTWHGPADGVSYAEMACEWYDAGARLIGGCCRTGPGDIAAVAEALRGRGR